MLQAKLIPLKMHASKGSPCGRAPAIAGERVLCAQLSPLRRLRRHLSQRARLFVSSIITQIGRENKFSAEILFVADSRGRLSLQNRCKLPYEKEPKCRLFVIHICVLLKIASHIRKHRKDRPRCGRNGAPQSRLRGNRRCRCTNVLLRLNASRLCARGALPIQW